MPFRWRSDDGAVHLYGMLVAGLGFIAVVAVLLLTVSRPAIDSTVANPNREAGQDLDASLLAAVLASPGTGWAGGADAVTRLGVGADNGSGLDAARIAALQGALLDASAANGKVDYPDARAGFALPPFQEFNLTIARIVPGNASYDVSYGPAPPEGTAVSVVERTAYVWDGSGHVALRLSLRTWDAP